MGWWSPTCSWEGCFVSRYAFDQERNALIVCWGTGRGDAAAMVAELGGAHDDHLHAQELAGKLTELSEALWRTYTYPATAAESLETNSEGWRRQGERDAFAEVPQAIADPNLPSGGFLTQSYSPVEECAHRVGRVLHTIGNPELTAAVVAEAKAETAAIEQAELGDLTGRARQAVMLDRAGASPAQVEAADRMLNADPFGSEELFTEVDPTAAAVAAAHWLQAAADVVSEASGITPTLVVQESDNISALPHETPTLVLELLDADESPYDVVTGLVRQAMAVAEGRIPDPEGLVLTIEEVQKTAQRYGHHPEVGEELLASIRATPLDPLRPSRDLLEDLVAGIGGCRALFGEYAYDELDCDDTDDDSAEAEGDGDEIEAAVTDRFIELVRAEAEENRHRLL
ncbi:hypothetical protein ACFO4E_05610 [Nocardiopsis mangrovi]|uniref:DUF222 domain-containing protein n=1 Tax=Nocardiopsis mangrovi TaxID=1179818 RepID=A0ABV9DS84_9ACTN